MDWLRIVPWTPGHQSPVSLYPRYPDHGSSPPLNHHFQWSSLINKNKTRNIGWNIQLLASLKLIPKSFQNTQLRHQRIKIAPTPAAWLVPVSYEMWKFINIWWNRSPILQGQWPPAGPGPLLSEWGQHHLERRRMVSYKARTKHIAKTWEIASTL